MLKTISNSVRSCLSRKFVSMLAMGAMMGSFATAQAATMNLYMAVNNDANTSHTIQVIGNDGTGRTTLLTRTQPVGDIQVDAVNNKMFWLEDRGSNKMELFSANLDGTGLTSLSTQVIGAISSIALDPVAQRVYRIESSANRIKSVKYDNTDPITHWTAPTGTDPNVRGFALDAANSRFFFFRNPTSPTLAFELVSTDFSGGDEILLATGSASNGTREIEIDPNTNTVYYTRRQNSSIKEVSKTDMVTPGLNFANLTGTMSSNDLRALAVDSVDGLIYYSSIGSNQILTSNLDGTVVSTFLDIDVENVTGLALAPIPEPASVGLMGIASFVMLYRRSK